MPQADAAASADGVFVPALTELAVVRRLASSCPLPLNLMAVPGLASPETLRAAGVRRLSHGPAPFCDAYGRFAEKRCARSKPLSFAQMNALAQALQ